MKQISFETAEQRMLPGDVIAFSGSSLSSWLLFMRDGVSHIGILVDDPTPTILEAAIYLSRGRLVKGVIKTPAKKRCAEYKGEVMWLPLSPSTRERFYDRGGYYLLKWFATGALGKHFNYRGGLAVTLSVNGIGAPLQRLLHKRHNGGYHCGELVAIALKCIGVPISQDAKTVHPADICALDIFTEDRYLLKC